jgi:hypothetical protein
MKTATYKVTILILKESIYRALIVDARGIRWAIENAAKKFQIAHRFATEGVDFEIIEVEKV